MLWTCFLEHVTKGKMEGRVGVTGRRRRGYKQVQDDLKEKTEYWKFKEETLDRPLWRTHFGRGYGSVVRQTADLIL